MLTFELTETLADEVRPFGIRTVIVEPGAFRTGLFGAGAPVESQSMPEYAETVGPTREFVATGDGTQPGDPGKAARDRRRGGGRRSTAAAGAGRRRHRQRPRPPGPARRGALELEAVGRDTAID